MKCLEENCKSRSFFGKEKKEYCSLHKKEGMKSFWKMCKEEGCNKVPNYGIEKAEYCSLHKKEGMKDIKHKKCKEENCIKLPWYGIKNREYCTEHKKEGMKSFRSKCKEEDCNKTPSYGFEKIEYCSIHKKKGMKNIKHKKCKEQDCKKIPSFGTETSEYCAEHKKEGMKSFRSKCKEEDCKKIPNFGIEKAEYCAEHKQEGMKSFWKTCKEEDCNKTPCYGVETPEFCFKHKTDKMKDLKNKKCIKCNLFRINKQPFLCSYCNPNKRQKTKENEIEKLFVANNIQFIKDKNCAESSSCNKYRPDFLIDRNTYFLIIECDEDAHRQYDRHCETIRMNNICYNLGLPCVFLRYNPDNKSVSKKEKEQTLLERVKFYLEKESIETSIEIEYLFY